MRLVIASLAYPDRYGTVIMFDRMKRTAMIAWITGDWSIQQILFGGLLTVVDKPRQRDYQLIC